MKHKGNKQNRMILILSLVTAAAAVILFVLLRPKEAPPGCAPQQVEPDAVPAEDWGGKLSQPFLCCKSRPLKRNGSKEGSKWS